MFSISSPRDKRQLALLIFMSLSSLLQCHKTGKSSLVIALSADLLENQLKPTCCSRILGSYPVKGGV